MKLWTNDLKNFAQEPLHKCLYIWSKSNGRSRSCHFWLNDEWRSPQAKKIILKDAAFEGGFSLAKDPLLFQTEYKDILLLVKEPMVVVAGERNYLKRCT